MSDVKGEMMKKLCGFVSGFLAPHLLVPFSGALQTCPYYLKFFSFHCVLLAFHKIEYVYSTPI